MLIVDGLTRWRYRRNNTTNYRSHLCALLEARKKKKRKVQDKQMTPQI